MPARCPQRATAPARARKQFWQKAGAVYVGGETPCGPLYLGYGRASGGHASLYLFLGLP